MSTKTIKKDIKKYNKNDNKVFNKGKYINKYNVRLESSSNIKEYIFTKRSDAIDCYKELKQDGKVVKILLYPVKITTYDILKKTNVL